MFYNSILIPQGLVSNSESNKNSFQIVLKLNFDLFSGFISSSENEKDSFQVLIPANTPIPVSNKRKKTLFSCDINETAQLLIFLFLILQGEKELDFGGQRSENRGRRSSERSQWRGWNRHSGDGKEISKYMRKNSRLCI